MTTEREIEYFERRLKHVAEIVTIARHIATVAQFGETNRATVPGFDLWRLQDAIQKLDAAKPTVDRERGLAAVLERIADCEHEFERVSAEEYRCRKCSMVGGLEK